MQIDDGSSFIWRTHFGSFIPKKHRDDNDCQNKNQFIVKYAEIACRSMWKSIEWQQFAALKFLFQIIFWRTDAIWTIETNVEEEKKRRKIGTQDGSRQLCLDVFGKCHCKCSLFSIHLVAFWLKYKLTSWKSFASHRPNRCFVSAWKCKCVHCSTLFGIRNCLETET